MSKLSFLRHKQMRWYSTVQKIKVTDSLNEQLTNNDLKHRQHPGIFKLRQIDQPSWLMKTISSILHEESLSPNLIYQSGQRLAAHLNGRHPPLERNDVRTKWKMATEKFHMEDSKDPSNYDKSKERTVMAYFRTLCHNWAPINYDKFTSISYLVGRSVPEYCVLYRIFYEISSTTDFSPKSIFDYGSGVGTVTWAASDIWRKSINTYYCVDVSPEMNEISEHIVKTAIPTIKPHHIFYRQFFPVSPIPTYDIVVSAYSLFELPSQKSRLKVIADLWRKTEHYMVIVEQGTRAGFKLVNEARDFILDYEKDTNNVHVFSPCPHDVKCPRLMTDNTPCNFELSYLSLPLPKTASYKQERYSYVVLKKGPREEDTKWPRIVRPVLKRSAHVICRVCTAGGKLEEHIFTTWKNGKNTYRCARCSRWGDRLPFEPENVDETE